MSENELVFPNAWGGVLGPNGFRRKFRELRGEDCAWVTPKTYWKAVATIIAEELDDHEVARLRICVGWLRTKGKCEVNTDFCES